jgi:hypothetical protein
VWRIRPISYFSAQRQDSGYRDVLILGNSLDLRRHVEHVDGHGGDAQLRDRMKPIACRRLIGHTSRRPRRTSI